MLSGRRFMITSAGRMGVGPQITKPGDLLCVLLGSYVAFILRSCGDNFYKLIGDCDVHGIMDGEIIETEKEGQYVYQDFYLI
ncbi:uncharacterized protein K444DRAFT_545582 [Hyaloscypha bicolor E]|uniref:Uncharacterized protein n=1 Tax=Hyaloscypha bicolor E TaxID=1095630 RepID=A0A2J6SLC5_9HELO|nr:uncharacterized protein K444DRAFT_545582 [Hyaloscypha bicolor E]PMD51571.1 hypothetical protein K444DRAFT_545582 [Hyaloscypha bicolor E]